MINIGLSYESFINPLFEKAQQSGVPLSGTFELTNRCTLNCKMCYIHNQKINTLSNEKTTEWWLDLAEKGRDAGMLLLLLTGGEPMLREDFDDIYIGAKKLGLLVSVNTNGTLITKERIELFKKMSPQKMNISLYGASRETYQKLCGNGDAYEHVIWAIKELKKAGINIKINYTINPYNVADIPDVIDFAKTTDVPIQPVSYMFPPVRGCAGEAVRLPAEAAAKAHLLWNKISLGDEDFKKYLDFSSKRTEYDDVCTERINCRAGSTVFWVTYDGKMTPCGMLTRPSVEIKDFNAAWQYINTEREKILLPYKCTKCSLRKNCDFCAAVSFAETGEFDKVPQYACEKAKAYQEIAKQFLSIDN